MRPNPPILELGAAFRLLTFHTTAKKAGWYPFSVFFSPLLIERIWLPSGCRQAEQAVISSSLGIHGFICYQHHSVLCARIMEEAFTENRSRESINQLELHLYKIVQIILFKSVRKEKQS